jgi:hypothetical protein
VERETIEAMGRSTFNLFVQGKKSLNLKLKFYDELSIGNQIFWIAVKWFSWGKLIMENFTVFVLDE